LLGVYSDQGGYPSSRLGITASTAVNPIAGWQTIQLSTPIPVVSGQKVWLSWVFQIAPGIHYTAGTPGRAASSNTWANGMPASFGTSTIAPNKYSIYCTYSIGGAKSAEIFTSQIDPVNAKSVLKAYPNPFTEKLTIEFSSVNDTKATLEIYNIVGSRLEVLYDGPVIGGDLYMFEYLPRLTSSQIVVYRLTLDEKSYIGKLIYNEKK